LFRGLSGAFPVGLYHSWAVREVPQGYDLTARDAHGVVMAMENEEAASFGVQFHPESIMCPGGMDLLANFLAFS
ncbi:MAG: aminodeoxychorismate/anthranilate synthase component II, partial [Flavobacteriia bacterium]|nr:aminodeoxychorismate/anthranilate synthase component II [Flavobacteriia bacterium]